MKNSLKILLYFSIVLSIAIFFISKDSPQKNEITKVVIEQERNISEKIEIIEKVKEIEKEINQKLIVTAKDEQNITKSVGYWKLIKIEKYGSSITYEYNKDKQIIKVVVDNNKEGSAHRVWTYKYDDKGRETYGTNYYNGKVLDKNFSNQFTDDGKIKEKNTLHYSLGEIYGFTNTKIIYNDKGDILKEIEVRSDLDENGEPLVNYKYEKKYYYSDTDQLLEIIGTIKGKEEMHIIYQYEDERLVSTRGTYRLSEHNGGENYIYEDGVLREIYSFDTNYGYRKFYNEDGLVEEKKDFAFGSSYEKIKYFYDEDGKKIKAEHYKRDIDGEFEHVADSFFDDEETRKVFLNSDKVEITYDKKLHLGTLVIEKRRDVYDEHGNLIEIWDDASDKLIEKRFYRFVIENN